MKKLTSCMSFTLVRFYRHCRIALHNIIERDVFYMKSYHILNKYVYYMPHVNFLLFVSEKVLISSKMKNFNSDDTTF